MGETTRHRRILVIGSSGSGKSTLSRTLSKSWDLPVVHLDALYWQPGWQPTDRSTFLENVTVELEKSEWIMDGNFDSSLALRASFADLIIFLDYPRTLCLFRACKRAWMYRGTTRPDMGEGCPEKMDLEFARWIWNYPSDVKPEILQTMKDSKVDVISFSSPKQLAKWLDHFKQ